MKTRTATLFTALALALLPLAAGAVTDEPLGFGKAKFGTPIAEMKKLFPQMKDLTESLGSPVVGGPYITRYVLRKEKVEGLEKPADVELRFWKDKFWLYIVYLGENSEDAAVALLTKAHGSPGPDPKFPVWAGDKSTIVFERGQGRYAVNDTGLSKEAQAWFMEMLRSRAGAAAPPAAVAPPAAAAKPAAPADKPAAAPEKKP